jgi:Uma2 family endonuclease
MTTLLKLTKNRQDADSLTPSPRWKTATWEDYLKERDYSTDERVKLYFYDNQLLTQMGKEGINHASISDLFIILLGFWFSQHQKQVFSSLGRCLLEKQNKRSASPDLVVYLGEDYPKWQKGESRYLNLDQWRSPNLVGEISDTTLPIDLDQKKHLYADLGIAEYWVIDVQGQRVFAFQLRENGVYQECKYSSVFSGLPINLLEQTLARLNQESNSQAANWFLSEIKKLMTE